VAENGGRLDELRRVAGVSEQDGGGTYAGDVVAALEALDELDAQVVTAITRLIGPETDPDARLELLRALTDDPTGRYATGEVLGQRMADRLADARRAAGEYAALVADVTTGETDLQQFLEENVWLLGLDYARIQARRPLPRGAMDFILERFDAFHDVVELKTPQDPIIVAPDATDMPPPAHSYELSADLAQALAQAHVYRHTLTEHAQTAEALFGLPQSRDPRLIIVIGRADSLREHRAQVLAELNKSLQRVEIVPYDVLAKRANTVLDNVEQLIAADGPTT
jgi:hypothetical protein